MILVTGATGQLGKATIDFLLRKIAANNIAALVRDEAKAVNLKAKGVNVRIGDYTDFNSMVKAFAGIDKLLLISSSDMSDRAGQHINAINAAKEAGVKHIIYTNVDIKDINNSAISFVAESHAKTAEYLKNSGINYTLLNNNLYADVIPMFLGEKVLETGVFFPAGDGKAAFVSRLDLAEATATILASEGHENMSYDFSSDTSSSFSEIANILSDLSGKQVNYYSPSKEEFVGALTNAGVPEMMIGFTASFAEAIKHNEFDLPKNTLTELLGRKPTSIRSYLESIYFPQN